MRRTAWAGLVLLMVGAGGTYPADGKVSFEPLTYAQLTDAVRAMHGKVVLLDLWGEFCVPCKKEFPHFVALHRKYAEAGLAAVSVCLDDPSDTDARDRARGFLQAQRASTRNVLLLEKAATWQAKWKIVGPPCVFLFDRQGKLINRWVDKEIDYEAIGRRVAQLVNE